MKNMSVRNRLYLVVGWLAASLILIGFLGVLDLRATNAAFEDVYINRVEPLGQLKAVADLYAVNVVDTSHKVRDGAMSWKDARDSYAFVRAEKAKQWGAYIATYLTPEEKVLADEASKRMEVADTTIERLDRIVAGQNVEELRAFAAKEMYPAIDPLGDTLSKLIALQIRVAKEIYDESTIAYKNTVRIFIVIAVVALLVGLALARKIINGLLGELGGEPKQVVEVMKRMAEGDLSTEIQVNEKYPGSVLDSTKQMQGKMHAMISGVISSANQLSSSAGQLSTASTQLAVGIEAQGSATASMAASVEQLAVSVAHVSDSSSEGDKLASRSSALSRDGSDVIQRTTNSILSTVEKVQETSEEIARLEKESVSISAVVKVIKEVAEQTNLLALNAAIEAARAGEQGRGFAVVADEVRKLAERTSSATIEIGALIDRIQSSSRAAVKCMSGVVVDVGMGADMAKHAGVSIGEIAGMSDSVRQVSKEISNALSEQNVACTDIAQNVERVAQMSEENAAATQQVATSAQSLADISQGLASSVAYFRV